MQQNHSTNINSNKSSIFDGDEASLKAFYLLHFKQTKAYVIANSGTEDDAKDVYLEALVIAWRNIQNKKYTEVFQDALPAYIFKIAKYKWLDELRKRKKIINPNATALEKDELIEQLLVMEEQDYKIALIAKQFKLLGQRCQDVLGKFYFQKHSIKTIAEEFNWTEATAKNNKYRCLEKLRILLKEKLPIPK